MRAGLTARQAWKLPYSGYLQREEYESEREINFEAILSRQPSRSSRCDLTKEGHVQFNSGGHRRDLTRAAICSIARSQPKKNQ